MIIESTPSVGLVTYIAQNNADSGPKLDTQVYYSKWATEKSLHFKNYVNVF